MVFGFDDAVGGAAFAGDVAAGRGGAVSFGIPGVWEGKMGERMGVQRTGLTDRRARLYRFP